MWAPGGGDDYQQVVKDRFVLDEIQRGEWYISAPVLLNHNVPVWTDDRHAIVQNRVMIITGSFDLLIYHTPAFGSGSNL